MRKSFTPTRIKSTISHNNVKNNKNSRISRLSIKSMDIIKKNKSSKIVIL